MKPFMDIGTRNKPTFWEYGSAYSFLNTKLPATKYNIPLFLGFGKGESNKHCHHIDVIEDTRKLMIKEFKEGKYTKDFFENIRNVYRKPFELVKREVLEKSVDNKSLSEKVDIISKSIFETYKPMVFALKSQFLEEFFKLELIKILNKGDKYDEKKVNELTSLLLSPVKLTTAHKEEGRLFETQKIIGGEIKVKNKEVFEKLCLRKDVKDKLQKLAEDYGWFHMEYIQEPWNEEDYKKFLWNKIMYDKLKVKSPRKRAEETKELKGIFFKINPNSETIKELTYALQEFSYILDDSKSVMIKGNYLSLPIFERVANKAGLPVKDLFYLTLPEIKYLLEKHKKADKNLIEERKKCRAILLKGGNIKVFHGEKAARLSKELINEEEVEEMSEIKGTIVYPGNVKGKVKIISSIKDKDKFKNNDILVTHDGSAELTLFMKQAGAIVTNQGGMICHAAILAREMRIPCIVGTRIATKVLKDGDLVEVDADKGVVRKL